MTFLLDTHAWIWFLAEPERLNRRAWELIDRPEGGVAFSVASAWEIAIKHSSGKLRLPEPPGVYLPLRLSAQGISVLAVELRHGLQVADLPPHHRDPFDRLLVAQARIEELTLVTADRRLAAYDVEVLWAGLDPSPR